MRPGPGACDRTPGCPRPHKGLGGQLLRRVPVADAEVSLANWLAHKPPKLVSAHLNIPGDTLAKFPRGAQGIVPLP